MQEAQVKKIESIMKDLGDLIKSLEPQKPSEWDAQERLTAAHKQLRSINTSDLMEYKYT